MTRTQTQETLTNGYRMLLRLSRGARSVSNPCRLWDLSEIRFVTANEYRNRQTKTICVYLYLVR